MDIEKKLLDKLFDNPELYPDVIDAAVSAEMFEGDYKQVWEYALKHMKAHGTGPTDEAIKVQFPT